MKNPNIALLHEWLVNYSGAERVLEQLIKLYPESKLYAMVEHLEDKDKFYLQGKKINTSLIQNLPFSKSKYRLYLPLMPYAVEQLDVSDANIIISSHYAVNKGVLKRADQLHICYCHSPMRYAWDLYHQYRKGSSMMSGIKGFFAKYFLHRIRQWDWIAGQRVDHYIANSEYIAKRIWNVYRRKSTVIYPPVAVHKFELQETKEDFYLTASRMEPYKRFDLIVKAFNQMPDKKLVVIGDGTEFEKVKKLAGTNVTMMGFQSTEVLVNHMRRAKGFVFAAEEDFGIIPVETQACGTPVIAYGKGGSLETVKENETGIFFKEQTEKSIQEAIIRFEKTIFDPLVISKHAETFSEENFKLKFQKFVNDKWKEFNQDAYGK